MMNRWSQLSTLIALLALAACASAPEYTDDATADYARAKHLIAKGDYGQANMMLEKYDAKHPYSQYSIRVELLRIFAAYKNGEYVLSETLSDRFIDRHPRHPDVTYAKYMLGMSHMKESGPADRDPTQTLAAVDAFKRLIREHPQSSYARDGARRLQQLYDKLAAHELSVGKYYFDRERYVAAANRFQTVVQDYQTSSAIEESLYYLAASYHALGLGKDSHDIAVLLRHNYPRGEWSNKSKRFL